MLPASPGPSRKTQWNTRWSSGGDPAEQLRRLVRARHDGDGQGVVVQDVVDRLGVVLARAEQHDVPVGARIGVEEELGDDFVGAAEVEQTDLGEVEHRASGPSEPAMARWIQPRTATPVGRVTRSR